MNVRHLAAFAALTAASLAQATAITSTSGLTTTITENFDGGSSFSKGYWDTANDSDDYLWLGYANGGVVASYTFNLPTAMASLDLSFWYGSFSTPGSFSFTGHGSQTLANTLPYSRWNSLLFIAGNPGPDDSFSGDALYKMPTLTGLAAGDYTLAFTVPTNGDYLKIDNLVITATAVPEPGTYAMMLAGLGALGFMGRRRQAV